MKYKADLVISIDRGVNEDYCCAVIAIHYKDGTTSVISSINDKKDVNALYDICEKVKIKKLKAQAFDIINKKCVDTMYLRTCFDDNQPVARYNEYVINNTFSHYACSELTEEEFDTLKKAFKYIHN